MSRNRVDREHSSWFTLISVGMGLMAFMPGKTYAGLDSKLDSSFNSAFEAKIDPAFGAAFDPAFEAKFDPAFDAAFEKMLDPAAMDLSADPCVDFDQYACGRWKETTVLPAEMTSLYRSFTTIDEEN